MIQCAYKAKLIFGFTTLFALISLKISNADLVFSIDVDPSIGIQNTREVTPSTTVRANLFLELTGTTTLDSYRTSIIFESTGLVFVNGSSILTPPANYSRQSGLPLLSGGNVFGPFEASSNALGFGLAAPQGPFLLGSLDFTTQNIQGTYTITPFEVANLDGSFDNGFNRLTPTFLGASITITAVPEPGTFATLLFVLSMSVARLSTLRRRVYRT